MNIQALTVEIFSPVTIRELKSRAMDYFFKNYVLKTFFQL